MEIIKVQLENQDAHFQHQCSGHLTVWSRHVENHSYRQEQTGCFLQEVHEKKDTQSFLAKPNFKQGTVHPD